MAGGLAGMSGEKWGKKEKVSWGTFVRRARFLGARARRGFRLMIFLFL